jgi:hypothetical protein
VSIPVRIVVDWNKLEICGKCAERITLELTKVIRERRPANLDISVLLCDECWKHNVDSGAIKAELDPQVVRRRA